MRAKERTLDVEKFAELVGKDPALLAKLGLDKVNADSAAAVSLAAFITTAAKVAKAHGVDFVEEDAQAFMDAEAKAAASDELSDTQSESVAGGLLMERNTQAPAHFRGNGRMFHRHQTQPRRRP